ncbi:MAG: serine/threonine-protein kinase [Myxococcota bacterium]
MATLIRWFHHETSTQYPEANWSDSDLAAVRSRVVAAFRLVVGDTYRVLREETFRTRLDKLVNEARWPDVAIILERQLVFVFDDVQLHISEGFADLDQLLLPTTTRGTMRTEWASSGLVERSVTMKATELSETPIIIADRYVVDSVVARRPHATVYEAHREDIGLKVAIKVLVEQLHLQQSKKWARFRREAKLLARVTSPHVVSLYDYGLHQDNLFLAMEWLPGRTLYDIVQNEGSLPIGRAIDLVEQLVTGLASIHSQGIVHRDIKPSNVMVTRGPDGEEHLQIFDFGIGKDLLEPGSLTSMGTLVGSPRYLAPEQVQGLEVGSWTDQYAVGVTLFHLLTGDYPHPSKTIPEMLFATVHRAPRELGELLDASIDQHRAAADVIRRCLQKRPEDRYRDTLELREALRAVRRQPREPLPAFVRSVPARRPRFNPSVTLTVRRLSEFAIPTPLTIPAGPPFRRWRALPGFLAVVAPVATVSMGLTIIVLADRVNSIEFIVLLQLVRTVTRGVIPQLGLIIG